MSCTIYNCDDELGTHTQNDCGSIVRGGYQDLILLSCGHSITDPSDEVEVAAAIAANEATLIRGIKGAIPIGSPVKVTSMKANEPDIIVKYDFSGTWMDQNVNTSNVTFYNQVLDGRTFGGVIFHNADEGLVYMHSADTRCEGGLVMPDGNQEQERYEVTFIFSKDPDDVIPLIAPEPPGIFVNP
jgi:hypothetical protein